LGGNEDGTETLLHVSLPTKSMQQENRQKIQKKVKTKKDGNEQKKKEANKKYEKIGKM
jgi:hypothetical protein